MTRQPLMLNPNRMLELARETLAIESQALQEASSRLNGDFVQAIEAMLACRGRVVVMGMGKSGLVGRKVAATLASTGTPAFFVHPAEASHGDLGMVQPEDVVLAISHSGESEELAVLLPALKRLGVPLLALTARPESTLGRHARWVLCCAVKQEACPLNLAPTASTTVQMALGDALAVALLDARGFKAEDFARSHPGGSLGRKLLTLVRDVMRSGPALPVAGEDASISQLMQEIGLKGLGAVAVVGDQNSVQGIFTDGDLRRLLDTEQANFRVLKARDVMKAKPRCVRPDALAAEAAELMERHRINCVLVTDDAGVLLGALNTHDLMQAKVI
jgi:arabinose-5-phosphate isomerase